MVLRPLRSFVVLLAAALPLAAPAQESPLQVLATVGMVADVARNVAGDCAAVTTLMGAGSDPHMFRPTAGDVTRLARAELILYVHPALEARLAEVLGGLRGRVPVLGVVEAAFEPADLLEDPEVPGAIDPHLWMDAGLWSRIAPAIAAAIGEQRPDCAPALAANATRVEAELSALHDWVADAIASIPEGRRLLVTAHDAFGYFARAYGIGASEAIEGISTESEASIADIRAVAAFVADRGVPAVFVETTVSPRTIDALIAEVQAMGHEVAMGGELYSDAMGGEGTVTGTYVGMIRANTVTIVTALGGALPDWPEALAAWAEEWEVQP